MVKIYDCVNARMASTSPRRLEEGPDIACPRYLPKLMKSKWSINSKSYFYLTFKTLARFTSRRKVGKFVGLHHLEKLDENDKRTALSNFSASYFDDEFDDTSYEPDRECIWRKVNLALH